MKRQCTGANAEVPNFETTQAPPPSHDVPELPADVWRIVCTQLVQLLRKVAGLGAHGHFFC